MQQQQQPTTDNNELHQTAKNNKNNINKPQPTGCNCKQHQCRLQCQHQQTKTPTPKKTSTPRKLPTPPPAQKISFKQTKKNGNLEVFINGKPVIDDDGKSVSKEEWNYTYDRKKRNDLSLQTIQGKGNKRGKKQYEPIQESAILYDPDDNNLWAN